MIPIGIKKVATMVILQHKDRYLLLKRAKAPNAGMYLPVGGKIEPFEDPKSCAIRETKEETGIKISNPLFCGILTESSPTKYNWISYIYKAEIEDQPAPNCDEGELEWIEEKDLAELPTPPTDMCIYQYVKNNQKFILNAIYNQDLELIEMREELTETSLI
jgi:8-oxo-dGTP diphosphatase